MSGQIDLPRQTPPWADNRLGRHLQVDISLGRHPLGRPPRQTPPPETATAADATHPTGMHSCFTRRICYCSFIFKKHFPTFFLQHYTNVHRMIHVTMEEFVRPWTGSINVTAPIQIAMEHSVKQVKSTKCVLVCLLSTKRDLCVNSYGMNDVSEGNTIWFFSIVTN